MGPDDAGREMEAVGPTVRGGGRHDGEDVDAWRAFRGVRRRARSSRAARAARAASPSLRRGWRWSRASSCGRVVRAVGGRARCEDVFGRGGVHARRVDGRGRRGARGGAAGRAGRHGAVAQGDPRGSCCRVKPRTRIEMKSSKNMNPCAKSQCRDDSSSCQVGTHKGPLRGVFVIQSYGQRY